MTEYNKVNLETKTPLILPDAQTVTEIEHYTDSLFRFRVTRPASMRFRSGEFVMIGLMESPNLETGKQKNHYCVLIPLLHRLGMKHCNFIL